MWHKFKQYRADFNADERGMESTQVLMISAIAAVCLIAIKFWWSWYADYFKQAVQIFIEN